MRQCFLLLLFFNLLPEMHAMNKGLTYSISVKDRMGGSEIFDADASSVLSYSIASKDCGTLYIGDVESDDLLTLVLAEEGTNLVVGVIKNKVSKTLQAVKNQGSNSLIDENALLLQLAFPSSCKIKRVFLIRGSQQMATMATIDDQQLEDFLNYNAFLERYTLQKNQPVRLSRGFFTTPIHF